MHFYYVQRFDKNESYVPVGFSFLYLVQKTPNSNIFAIDKREPDFVEVPNRSSPDQFRLLAQFQTAMPLIIVLIVLNCNKILVAIQLMWCGANENVYFEIEMPHINTSAILVNFMIFSFSTAVAYI